MSKLEINFPYYFKSDSELKKVGFDNLPSPDEFWSEEQVAQWKRDYESVNKVYENEESKGIPFDNLEKDADSIKGFKDLNI